MWLKMAGMEPGKSLGGEIISKDQVREKRIAKLTCQKSD